MPPGRTHAMAGAGLANHGALRCKPKAAHKRCLWRPSPSGLEGWWPCAACYCVCCSPGCCICWSWAMFRACGPWCLVMWRMTKPPRPLARAASGLKTQPPQSPLRPRLHLISPRTRCLTARKPPRQLLLPPHLRLHPMLQSLQRLLSRRPQSLRDLHLYSLRPPPLSAPPLYLLQSMRL